MFFRIRIRETWVVILCVASCWAFLLLYLSKNMPLLAYIFATLNCLQGLTIFIFFGLHDNEVIVSFYFFNWLLCIAVLYFMFGSEFSKF